MGLVLNFQHVDSQTKRTWANTQRKLLKATLRREFTLIQRTFFIYIFRSTQVPASCITSSAAPRLLGKFRQMVRAAGAPAC